MTTRKLLSYYAFFIFVQGIWGMPATISIGRDTPTSASAQMQADFSKNLAAVMNNMHNGVTTLINPSMKFGMDVVPNLINQGISTATERVNKIAAAGKEGFQKLGVGVGQAVGGGGVLGSSLAGGAMQVAGHGLGVGVDVADAGAKAGIDFLGRVGDNAASGISVGTTIGGSTLSTIGNGMIAAGTGVNVFSNGLATLLDVIGSRLSNGVNQTEQAIAGLMDAGVLKIENGALSFSTSAQTSVYNMLNSFLQILVNVQKLFDSLKISMNAGLNTGVAGATNTGTSAAGSGSAGGTTAGQTAKSVRGLSGGIETTFRAGDLETAQLLKPDKLRI